MKIKVILNLLKKLGAIDAPTLFTHYSSKELWKLIDEMELRRAGWKPRDEIRRENRDEENQKFYNILNYLKRNDFIIKTASSGKKVWRLTQAGEEKLAKLNSENKISFEVFKNTSVPKDELKIFIFDIPESLKQHRNWLRQTLVNLGFRMLQKSVWIGENKLPEEFLHYIRKLNILKYIHIFSVKNKGTIA